MNDPILGSWRPVLARGRACDAREAAAAIGRALAVEPRSIDSPFLADGLAGRALFFAYLGKSSATSEWTELGWRFLGRAIERLAEDVMAEGLYSGFAGVAWVAEHMGRMLAAGEVPGGGDANTQIDEVLLELLETRPWPGDYDLVRGLVGLAVYAFERLPRRSAHRMLEQIVARLDEEAVRLPDGQVSWLRKPHLLAPEVREREPRGHFNLGLAHGVPAILAVLAGAVRADVAVSTSASLLTSAWTWLMRNRLAPAAETTFSYVVAAEASSPTQDAVPARDAWCYGDPGAAAALHVTARLLANSEWEAQALNIARKAAERPASQCGCLDAGLCHGATGVALIYQRLWNATGDKQFAVAAKQWYERALEARLDTGGIAGFQAYYPRAFGTRPAGWVDDTSFLSGAEGIGLALLAGSTNIEPAWDRVLLTSLRVPGPSTRP